ncbi:protein RNA-directed DNA methylation 3-like [Poecilia formosa]|uniref:protein RNA-directed DNA methylation 3-like n=1 Tax=Poecilia formosa TaxID=48698 RepID=UPI0007B8E4A6|nr:PREDICTED: protein RNA-directed DNA methylation 3-like [Poecilia formosa]
MKLISGSHHTVALLLLTSDLRVNIPPHFTISFILRFRESVLLFYVQIGENAETGDTWGHLETPGDIWRHLGTSGDTWRHLGTSGDTWGHLETSGDTWGHLGTSGDIWRHLGTSGDTWGHLKTSGDIWRHLGTSGDTCDMWTADDGPGVQQPSVDEQHSASDLSQPSFLKSRH